VQGYTGAFRHQKREAFFKELPLTAFNKDIQIQVHSKAAGNNMAAVEDTNNMDAGKIMQCPINLLLTRLERADRRIQKTADPAADKGLCKGTSVIPPFPLCMPTLLYMRGTGFGLGKFTTFGGGMLGGKRNPLLANKNLEKHLPVKSYLH
jgi:hypothetical protein